jgi:GH3 auxin-responsive promoter
VKCGAAVANALWLASNLPAWRAFRSALHDPGRAQQSVLKQIMRQNASTAFGREHRLTDVRDVCTYQRLVPIRGYDDFLPWIARIRGGDSNVLTSEPVTRLATTSGSTCARKLIPYTRSLQQQFNRAVGPWIVDLMRQHPAIVAGPAYWSISPLATVDAEPSKVPIGFEEDSEYLGGIRRRLVDAVMAVPASVRRAPTIDEWRSQTIECLRRSRDLRLISVWHPSFLSILLDEMAERPNALWPHLQVISCWADGHAAAGADALARAVPGVTIQPKGIIATEGIVSIPFEGAWPLAIRSHFFEFLRDDGTIALADGLDDGAEYEVVMTTGGGLYRYRLADRVRVVGHLLKTPSIRFIARTGAVSDRFGEKLNESFVAGVLATLCRNQDPSWTFSMLAPEADRYVLYVEGGLDEDLLRRLDEALCGNPQYAHCRQLRQLKPAVGFRIRQHGAKAYLDRLSQSGLRVGDIKPSALSSLDGWAKCFEGEYLVRPE